MNKFKSADAGYSTVEATISLSFFIVAMMFVFAQIKVVIGENIMQNAVNSMAKEVSSYVYILDRLDMILEHSDDENKNLNGIIGNGVTVGESLDNCVNMLGDVFNGEKSLDDAKSAGDDMISAMTTFVNSIKEEKDSFGQDLKTALVYGGEDLVKMLANMGLSKYYEARLPSYLPMDYDKFCRYFNIDKSTVSFQYSRVFPTSDNNTVLVTVVYTSKSPVKFIPLDRKICKYAYTGAWVSSNKHELKITKSDSKSDSSSSDSSSDGTHTSTAGKGR